MFKFLDINHISVLDFFYSTALSCSGLTPVQFGGFLRQDGTQIADPAAEMIPDGEYVTLNCRRTEDPLLDYQKQIRCAYDKELGSRRLFGELSCFGKRYAPFTQCFPQEGVWLVLSSERLLFKSLPIWQIMDVSSKFYS